MLGGLYGLNAVQHGYLTMSQLLPVGAAVVGLHVLNDGLATLALVNAVYLLLPQMYIRYLSKEGEVTAYFINEFRNKSQQIKQGLSLCGSAFGMVLLSYCFTYFFDEEVTEMVTFPLKKNALYLLAFFLLFTIVNPLLEEWFWRIFLMKTYRDSWEFKLSINATYTALHFVVLYTLFESQWQMAAGFSTYFYSVGRAFEYIRSKYGLLTCLMTHYGMTVASSVVLAAFITRL